MMTLAIDQSITRSIDPRVLFYPSGIRVAAEERYAFNATGYWQDGGRKADANGWTCRFAQGFNRLGGEPFFRLCGAIGQSMDHAFAIGTHGELTVNTVSVSHDDCQLYFFANDWRCMYFNNRTLDAANGGPLTVTVTRLR